MMEGASEGQKVTANFLALRLAVSTDETEGVLLPFGGTMRRIISGVTRTVGGVMAQGRNLKKLKQEVNGVLGIK